MSWISTVAGVVLIAVGLNEVFHTVLHPTGRGRLTHFAAIWTWRLSSGLGRRGRSLAGPLATVATVLVWVGFQVVGWTLVYLPHVPDGFAYSPGIRLDEYPAVLEALYFSLVSMSTLGLGDAYPVEPWLRVAAPLQALIGFALLTAAVAWFLELYPGLGRRRALALRIALMERADVASHLPEMESGTASALLDTLTADLAQVRVDLWQNAESHYFTEEDPATSLAATLPYALRLARVGRESSDRAVQNSGHMLEGAIDDFAALASDQFIPGPRGTEAILLEYARQHRQRPSQQGAVSESPES